MAWCPLWIRRRLEDRVAIDRVDPRSRIARDGAVEELAGEGEPVRGKHPRAREDVAGQRAVLGPQVYIGEVRREQPDPIGGVAVDQAALDARHSVFVGRDVYGYTRARVAPQSAVFETTGDNVEIGCAQLQSVTSVGMEVAIDELDPAAERKQHQG